MACGLSRGQALLLALGCTLALPCQCYGTTSRYLLISSPSTGNVFYSRLPSISELAVQQKDRRVAKRHLLIDGGQRCEGLGCTEESNMGLLSPQGLAVHEGEALNYATLYVSDPDATNIYAYVLTKSRFGWLTASGQRKVLQNVVASGLAVDSLGNLFYTVKDTGEVNMLPESYLTEAFVAVATGGGLPEPQVLKLYSAQEAGAGGATVAKPVGIASDNFFVYWANEGGDETTGTLVKAPDAELLEKEDPMAKASAMQALSAKTEHTQAVAANLCLARDTIFFTGDMRSLYAVKTRGGSIAEVARNFSKPRGCVYDAEGTLYVADAGRGVVYSLAADMPSLRAVRYTSLAVDGVPDADQLAIFGAGTPRSLGHRVASPWTQGPTGVLACVLLAAATLLQF